MGDNKVLKFIVAVTKNYAIGKDGDLLLKIPKDLEFFKSKTLGNTVVMGRKTYESLPNRKALANRENIILTRNTSLKAEGFTVKNSSQEIIDLAKINPKNQIYIIGGEEIYTQFLDYCSEGYITKINVEISGDSFFPDIDIKKNWKKIGVYHKNNYNNVEYSIEKYKNSMII